MRIHFHTNPTRFPSLELGKSMCLAPVVSLGIGSNRTGSVPLFTSLVLMNKESFQNFRNGTFVQRLLPIITRNYRTRQEMLLPGITDLARITNTLDNRSPDAISTYESNFSRVQPCLPPDVQSFSPGLDAHFFCQSFLKFYASILNSLHSVPITFLLSIISTCHQNFYRIKHSSRC